MEVEREMVAKSHPLTGVWQCPACYAGLVVAGEPKDLPEGWESSVKCFWHKHGEGAYPARLVATDVAKFMADQLKMNAVMEKIPTGSA